MRDPYASLARAAMAEYGMFAKQRQALDAQIAKATDPQEREALQLRKEIEACDYMAITDKRIARLGEVLNGHETQDIKQQRDRASAYEEKAEGLREDYRELRQQQAEKTEPMSPEEQEQEWVKHRQQEWADTRAQEQIPNEQDRDR